MRNAYITTRNLFNPVRDFAPWFADSEEVQKFNPACDVEETEKGYSLNFDVPGISKEDVKIEVVENILTVSGERKFEKQTETLSRHLSERYYGTFKRVFTLPANIDAEKVEATYKDGVLQVHVPKTEESKPRQIKVS